MIPLVSSNPTVFLHTNGPDMKTQNTQVKVRLGDLEAQVINPELANENDRPYTLIGKMASIAIGASILLVVVYGVFSNN